jgi:hypothetical protein
MDITTNGVEMMMGMKVVHHCENSHYLHDFDSQQLEFLGS